MNREIDNKTILDKFAEKFCEIIERHTKYFICSGFTAIAHGRTRGTEDIDMIIEKIPIEKFIQLHKELIREEFECIQSDNPEVLFENYLNTGLSIRYVQAGKNFAPPEMEVKFAKGELDKEQLKTRKRYPMTSLNIYFSPIEATIAFKEESLKSQKDLDDARHLRLIYQIDEGEIKRIKREIRKIKR